VETPGGRLHIRWYLEASATPNAQLAFFAEFLAAAGVYESWVHNSHCFTAAVAPPTSGMFSAPFLSILARHHRYAHITGLRDGGVTAVSILLFTET
jgi:hypothetical protein